MHRNNTASWQCKLFINLIGFLTIAEKEIRRVLRIWIQTLIPPVITTTLYFVIFGQLIGQFLPPIDGYDYITYIFPGLVVMAMLTSAYNNVVSSFFSSKMQRETEELLISPLSEWIIVLGYVAGGVLRGLLVGAVVFTVGFLFTTVPVAHPLLFILTTLLTTSLFAIGGFINGVFAKKPDDVSLFSTFILTPLTYLGGVFYSISLLPHHWQIIAQFNPLLYVVNAFRYSMLDVSDMPIGIALSTLTLITLIALWFAVYLARYSKGLRQ